MKNAIWRSRAIAILGLFTILLAIFPGLPSPLKATLFTAVGFVITSLALIGSRRQAYLPGDKKEMVSAPKIEVTETIVVADLSEAEEVPVTQ